MVSNVRGLEMLEWYTGLSPDPVQVIHGFLC